MPSLDSRISTPVHDFFPTHLGSVRRAVKAVSRRRHLPPDQEQELLSDVCLKLIENDYAAVRSFRGESHVWTYVHTIAARALADRHLQAWGKWRPSAVARRLGATAVRLERLIVRDRLPSREAVGVVAHTPGSQASDTAVASLCATLQARPRARHVPLADVADMLRTEDAAWATDAADARQEAVVVRSALAAALRGLPPADRDLLRRRFADGTSIADLARATGTPQKRLYRRFERLLALLRRSLEASQVRREDVHRLVGHALVEIGDVFDAAPPC